jgi:putative nucleotidyltransferase with HDIG domain
LEENGFANIQEPPLMILAKEVDPDLNRLLDEMESGEISSIRRIVSEVIVMLTGPTTTVAELKRIIEIDPPLAANVLHMANSMYYSRGRSYRTIEDAVICLGFETVLRIVLTQKVCELFAAGDSVGTYSRRGLWRHCTAAAQLARLIQRREFGLPGETAYAIGLLHDIGIIIADQFRHAAFTEALRLGADRRLPLGESLQQTLGYDHARIGTALAQRWLWPAEMIAAIGSHHVPLTAPRRHEHTIRTLYVANRFCHAHGWSHGASNAEADEETWLKTLAKLSISELSLELLQADLEREMVHFEAQGLI